MSGCTEKIRPLFTFLILLSFLFYSSQEALAQKKGKRLRAAKHRYIIDVGALEESGNIELTRRGLRILKNLGSGKFNNFKLISANRFDNSDSAPQVEEFDPYDQFCIDLIKAGIAKNCSPDFEITIDDTVPNDPGIAPRYSGLPWGLSAHYGINAPAAWDVTTGSHEVVVAVIDTGVDYNHSDLRDNIWRNPGEVAGNGIDDDGNGYIDDVHGWNASANNGDPNDDNGHGTHCAGTIGAVGNNGLGVVGVNWNVKIMPVKFLDARGSGMLSNAITAINYVTAMKKRGVNVRVSNNSWGGGSYNAALHAAIKAANDAGIAFVAAAGNEANNNDARTAYPAGYDVPNVVSVAAIDKNGNKASFSNYGANTVDIAAPGVDIVSTWMGNSYNAISGTSMATPHVSGALALLLASEPGLTIYQAIDRLYATGRNMASLNGLVRTGRTLDVAALIFGQASPPPAATPAPIPCTYTTQSVAFNPDMEAVNAPLVMQADEFNFTAVSLPFSFLYYGEYISSLIISPNGLVYTKTAPLEMDYRNSRSAPLNSIAALHTDLYGFESPYGVRVLAQSDRVTIFWHAVNYEKRGSGDIKVWLTLHTDGRLERHSAIQNPSLLKHVSKDYTIGATGPSADKSVTYAYNSNRLDSFSGVQFVQSCGAGQEPGVATVKKIRFTRKKARSKSVPRVFGGKGINIDLIGTGVGNITLNAAFNGQMCPLSATVGFNNGARLTGTMPRVPKAFSSLRISAGEAKKSINLSSYFKGRIEHHKRKNKRLNSEKLSRYCSIFFNSLSMRN